MQNSEDGKEGCEILASWYNMAVTHLNAELHRPAQDEAIEIFNIELRGLPHLNLRNWWQWF